MINLVLSILSSTSLFVIFKYFDAFKINTLQAIVVNYFVASIFGLTHANAFGKLTTVSSQPWFFGALILGLSFISIFFIMAKTSQENGVSVASVAGKMSLAIPVVCGVILYNESLSLLKVLGIILALGAVYLTSAKEKKENSIVKGGLLFPILLFLGSGIIDTFLKYIETNYVKDVPFFSGSIFAFAFLLGSLILLTRVLLKKEVLEFKNVIAGVIIGIPNYFSIIYFIKSLQINHLDTSVIFTINNVGIVLACTLVGILLFKEKLSFKNSIGVITAIVGIILVTIA